jgi:hypothetical protein
MILQYTSVLLFSILNEKESISPLANFELFRPQFHGDTAGCSWLDSQHEVSQMVYFRITVNKKINGPSGNRTRVLGFEAQEDILYPMDPSHLLYIKSY